MFNFAEVYEAMARAGAALVVEASELKPTLADLLDNPQRREAMRKAARAFSSQSAHALDDTWTQLQRLLP